MCVVNMLISMQNLLDLSVKQMHELTIRSSYFTSPSIDQTKEMFKGSLTTNFTSIYQKC